MKKIEHNLEKLFKKNDCENDVLNSLIRDKENLDVRNVKKNVHYHKFLPFISPIFRMFLKMAYETSVLSQ